MLEKTAKITHDYEIIEENTWKRFFNVKSRNFLILLLTMFGSDLIFTFGVAIV
jgi:hypothetical protein